MNFSILREMSIDPSYCSRDLAKRLEEIRRGKWKAKNTVDHVAAFEYVLQTAIMMVKQFQALDVGSQDPIYKGVGALKNKAINKFDSERTNPYFLLDGPVFDAACDLLTYGLISDALEALIRSIVKK